MKPIDTPQRESTWLDYFLPLANEIIVFFLLLLIFFPYLSTEIKTFLHRDSISKLEEFCLQTTNTKPENIKIIQFSRPRSEIKFYCLYKDKNLNLEITINQIGDNWRTSQQRNFNQPGSFFWPFYI